MGALKTVVPKETYDLFLAHVPTDLPPRYRNLSVDERACIYAYSTDEKRYSFNAINPQLRFGTMSPRVRKMIEHVENAIPKIIKDHSCHIYYRHVRLSREQVKKIYRWRFTVRHAAFTSVSAANEDFMKGKSNTIIRIVGNSKRVTPAYIAPIAHWPDEEEFLFPTNTEFLVLGIKEEPTDGRHQVWLMECPNGIHILDH